MLELLWLTKTPDIRDLLVRTRIALVCAAVCDWLVKTIARLVLVWASTWSEAVRTASARSAFFIIDLSGILCSQPILDLRSIFFPRNPEAS